MKNTNALIIIAKFPDADTVKTRLRGKLSDEQRLELYISMLENTVNKLKTIPGVDTFIAYAPSGARTYFSHFGTRLISLDTRDLGINMFNAFKEVFGSGYKKACLVGTDIPDLTGRIILEAFRILNRKDLVFGPASDGGYYLVGMRKLVREIFANVPWSSDQTLEKSLHQAEKFTYTVGFSKTLSDVDTLEDVSNLGLLRN